MGTPAAPPVAGPPGQQEPQGMRLLPCFTCRTGALAGPTQEPLIVAGFSSPVFVYRCGRCKKTQRIVRAQFLALPVMTHLEIAKLLPDLVLAHYMG